MRQPLRPFYIFALNTNEEYEKNILCHEGLTNTQFKELQGMYKGKSEISYLVDADFENIAKKLAKEYNQETILYVDETRDTFLLWTKDWSQEKLGKWQRVNNVLGRDNYTIDLSTGVAYVAE